VKGEESLTDLDSAAPGSVGSGLAARPLAGRGDGTIWSCAASGEQAAL